MISEAAESNSKTHFADSLPMAISEADLDALRCAYQTLEHPSLAARLSNVIGTPIETAIHLLPRNWYRRVNRLAENAITKALKAAVSSMRRHHEVSAHELYYRSMVAGSGAVGGFFGLPGLVFELPLTTTLMLRGIAEIARDEGEDIHSHESQLACIQVFALGGQTEIDDAAETGYYGVRLALSGYMTAAFAQVAQHGFKVETGPAIVQIINAVAHRFGAALTQRTATHLIPVVGAVGAAAVNTIFMQHFQNMARAHFTVRRLERKYGEQFVRAQYESLEQEDQLSRSSR